MSYPFTITLEPHPQGYTFVGINQSPAAPPTKSKVRHQPTASKIQIPPNSNISLRWMKEIGALTNNVGALFQQKQKEQEREKDELRQKEEEKENAQIEEEGVECEVTRDLPPSPAEWFSFGSIHQKEQSALPEFFTGTNSHKTPQMYMKYRNFMVQAYERNPRRYLTFISCRRVLRGDVNCLLRVWKFLEEEGVINFGLGVEGDYKFNVQPVDKARQLNKRPQTCLKHAPSESEETLSSSPQNTDNLTLTVINKNFSRAARVYCSKCKLICGVVWMEKAEESKVLCWECYQKGVDGEGWTRMDLGRKMESQGKGQAKQLAKGPSWNIDDNIKLLSFMSTPEPPTSWAPLMNQYQPRKSFEDIILQFLQFPITNFQPDNKELKVETKWPQEQIIGVVNKMYKESAYAGIKELKEEEIRENDVDPLHNFKRMTRMILGKYTFKMQNLQTIESIVLHTNNAIFQQPYLNRIMPQPASQVESSPSPDRELE